MFLSIIIPVYNTEKYIGQCLDSCLEQNIDRDDYEIICINDGSKDGSLQILKEYASKYPNITILDQLNSGVSVARNRGIRYAKADYIWFIDSDDVIQTNCLQELKEAVKEAPNLLSFYGYSFAGEVSLAENWLEKMTYWGFVALHIYRREMLQENDIFFDSQIFYGEDELFYVSALERADAPHVIEKEFYFYRQHENSAMSQLKDLRNQQKRLDSVIRAMILLKEGLEKGTYAKDETVSLLRGRYGLCPYLVASLDRKNTKVYLQIIHANHLFDVEFVKKYGLLSKRKFVFLYQKERFVDKTIVLIKKLLPNRTVKFIKSVLKQ